MSAPAAKAFSEPVMTMHPMLLSASRRSAAASNSSLRAELSAFKAEGRLRRMRPTRPFFSTLMVSLLMVAPRCGVRSLLAYGAEEGRSSPLDDALDCSAIAPGTRLARAIIDAKPMLDLAERAVSAAVIAQRGAAGPGCRAQHRLDRHNERARALVRRT